MSDEQETKPTETPKEDEPKKEEEDTVKEEESTARGFVYTSCCLCTNLIT